MRRILFSNAGIKLLAVALAISFWFFVTYRGQSEMAIDVPIGFKNVPKGLELLHESARTVTLSLRGHERLLKSLRPVDISIAVDLSNAKKGETMYYLDKNSIMVPRTVDVLRVEPAAIKVVLDESIVKALPVKASIVGIPEKGFKIASVRVDPSVVTVEGAKSELSRIAALRTEPIDVTGFDTDIRESARISTNGKNIRTRIPEVTVTIGIKR